jgi:hypothetical protein
MSLSYSSSTRIFLLLLLSMSMMMVRPEVVPSNAAELVEGLFDNEDVARDNTRTTNQAPTYSPAYFQSIDIKRQLRCRPSPRKKTGKCVEKGDACGSCFNDCCHPLNCVEIVRKNPRRGQPLGKCGICARLGETCKSSKECCDRKWECVSGKCARVREKMKMKKMKKRDKKTPKPSSSSSVSQSPSEAHWYRN